jgi:hypothetical protein
MRKLLIAVFFCSTTFVSSAVKAQNNDLFEIEIPFEFTVTGVILPAGKYKVGRFDPMKPNVVILRNTSNGKSRSVLTIRVETETPSSCSCLIFMHRRDKLTLYQVWTVDAMSGNQLPLQNDAERGNADTRLSSVTVRSNVAERAKK